MSSSYSSRSGALRDHYEAEDLPWEVVEKAARDKIARNWRPGKKQLILAGTEHLPGRKMVSVRLLHVGLF